MTDGRLLQEALSGKAMARAENQAELLRRVAACTERDAEIGRLTERRQTLLLERLRYAMDHPDDAMRVSSETAGAIAAINAERRGRVAALGCPEDYLEPIYTCPLCKDTGFVGEPLRETCACVKREIRRLSGLRGESPVPPDATFENWKDSLFPDQAGQGGVSQRASMLEIRRVFERYAEEFPDNKKPNALLSGKSGLGKTYLMGCIANRLLARGFQPEYVTAYDLINTIRGAVLERDNAQQALRWQKIRGAPMLMVDDLGIEPMMENLTIVHLSSLFDERLARKRHTIIATNLTGKDLINRYTDRVFSRIADASATHLIKFEGVDVRRIAGR